VERGALGVAGVFQCDQPLLLGASRPFQPPLIKLDWSSSSRGFARRGAGRSNRRVPIFFRRLFVKQVIAVVKPYLVERVLENLKHAPLEVCCVSEVKGYGRQKSYLDEYKGSEYSAAFLPKVEIALWVDDLRVDEVVRTIVEVARTGRMGDGKIFVLPSEIPGGREIDLA
jgi:nitrogen regulatory protein PII